MSEAVRKAGRKAARKAARKAGGKANPGLASLLTKRFGRLPEPIEARVAAASPVELQAWGVALLDAPTLDSVFAKP